MSDEDRTPDGEPIETYTFWLQFPEGDLAISADLTQWNAAMRRVRAAADWNDEAAPPAQGG